MNGNLLNNRYELKAEIGAGAFGKVFVGIDKTTLEKVALKRLRRADIDVSPYLKSAFRKEIQIMRLVDCVNSVKLIEEFESDEFYFIVMELCNCDLEKLLSARKNGFDSQEVIQILRQTNGVFKILKEESIIHRDIKIKNILVKIKKKGVYELSALKPSDFCLKLSDFGFSKVLDESDITKTKLGTPAYMAPEILQREEYSSKADIWAMGVIIYQLLYKKLPFYGVNEREILKKIKENNIEFDDKIDSKLRELLLNMLQADKTKRFGWEEYFNAPVFKKRPERLEIERIDSIEEFCYLGRKMSDDTGLSVVKVKREETLYLLKTVPKALVYASKQAEQIFRRELELMNTLQNCEFVVQVEKIMEDSSNFYILTEYFEGKTLASLVRGKKEVGEIFAKKVISQLLEGVKEIKKHGLTFSFVNLDSFRFKFYEEDCFLIKFFDFGIGSLFLEEETINLYLLKDSLEVEKVEEKTNVLNFGMCMFELLAGTTWFSAFNPSFPEKARRNSIEKKLNPLFLRFIEEMCMIDGNLRSDWGQVLCHPFLKHTIEGEPLNKGKVRRVSSGMEREQFESFCTAFLQRFDCFCGYFENFVRDKVEKIEQLSYFPDISVFITLALFEVKSMVKFLNEYESFDGSLSCFVVTEETFKQLKTDISGLEYLVKQDFVDELIEKGSKLAERLVNVGKKVLKLTEGLNISEIKMLKYFTYLFDRCKGGEDLNNVTRILFDLSLGSLGALSDFSVPPLTYLLGREQNMEEYTVFLFSDSLLSNFLENGDSITSLEEDTAHSVLTIYKALNTAV